MVYCKLFREETLKCVKSMTDIDVSKLSTMIAYFCKEIGSQEIDEIELLTKGNYRPAKTKTFRQGELVGKQGESINSLVMLSRGRVRTEIISQTGEMLYTNEYDAPFPLVATLLYSKKHRFVNDIIALEECEVEYYDFEMVDQLLGESELFRHGFLTNAGELIYRLSEQLQIFSIRKIKGKLAYYLLHKAEPSGFFDLGMTVTSLAQYFGVTRSALSRVLAELTNEGTIYYTKGFGEIRDYQRLRNEI